ncbi:MAG: ABC1 kinase family protein [bacterium]
MKIGRGYRYLQRYRQILMTLARHGFGFLVARIDADIYTKFKARFFSGSAVEDRERESPATRLRMVLEELGPTFIKAGQVLSTRIDLLRPDMIEELSKLQDTAPTLPFDVMRSQIERSLERDIDELFDDISEEPMAAASMAQVHRATLPDGSQAVVKVQRPGIRRIIETDLDILEDIARLLVRGFPELAIYNPVEVIDQIRRTLMRELDFAREGRNIDRFANNFKGSEIVVFPKVYWELTGERVLTMQAIDGIKVSLIEKIRESGLDPKAIADNIVKVMLHQIFVDGFFHADLHPGNIFVLENNAIALIDCGMVGRLDEQKIFLLSDLFVAIFRRDFDGMVKTIMKMGVLSEDVDAAGLKMDILDFTDRYYNISIEDLKVGAFLNEVIGMISRYRVRIPADLAILGKAVMNLEGILWALDPEFNLMSRAESVISSIAARRYDPQRLLREAGKVLEEAEDFLLSAPAMARGIMGKLRDGKLKLRFDLEKLDRVMLEFDRIANRLSFSLIISALIVGTALVIQANIGFKVFGFPVLGVLGFLIAGALGLWLVAAILRSGRL